MDNCGDDTVMGIKKPGRRPGLEKRSNTGMLCSFLNPTLFDTRGTHPHADRTSVHECTDVLEVGDPATPGLVVRMADVIAADRPFSANFANSCHDQILELCRMGRNVSKYTKFISLMQFFSFEEIPRADAGIEPQLRCGGKVDNRGKLEEKIYRCFLEVVTHSDHHSQT